MQLRSRILSMNIVAILKFSVVGFLLNFNVLVISSYLDCFSLKCLQGGSSPLQSPTSNVAEQRMFMKPLKFMTSFLHMKLPPKDVLKRKKKKFKRYMNMGLMIAAVMTKIWASIYKVITLIALKAFMIGKLALVLSTIMGFRLITTPSKNGQTTVEIIKHPIVKHIYTQSSESHGRIDDHF